MLEKIVMNYRKIKTMGINIETVIDRFEQRTTDLFEVIVKIHIRFLTRQLVSKKVVL